jgi:ElaB/YqjD/DUF883 family membrane-anchored ribosome-binding protein
MAQAQTGNRGEVAEAVRHAAKNLSEDLARTARDTQSAAAELTAALRHGATELREDAIERARGAVKTLHQQVREHPIAWTAAATGAGVLLGLLLRRR